MLLRDPKLKKSRVPLKAKECNSTQGSCKFENYDIISKSAVEIRRSLLIYVNGVIPTVLVFLFTTVTVVKIRQQMANKTKHTAAQAHFELLKLLHKSFRFSLRSRTKLQVSNKKLSGILTGEGGGVSLLVTKWTWSLLGTLSEEIF